LKKRKIGGWVGPSAGLEVSKKRKIGGWVGPNGGLEVLKKRKIPGPLSEYEYRIAKAVAQSL
jgi:hypothetical protein